MKRNIVGSTARFGMLCLILGCFVLPAAADVQTWNVSCVEGAYNYTSVSAIPATGAGDTIRIWGVEGHTYEGGFTIAVPDVRIMRWEGSPTRPLITNTSQTAPAVTVLAGNVTLQGLNISGNSLAGDGAAVSATGTYDTRLQGFTITDCVFTGNMGTAIGSNGGAVRIKFIDDGRITDTVFESNSALFHGGGVYFDTANNPILTHTTFGDNTAKSGGGAYFYKSANPTLTGVTFENNEAVEDGGGLFFSVSDHAHLTDTTLTNNIADTGTGGGGYFKNSDGAIITNCLFGNDENLYAESSTATILNETTPILQTNIAGGPYLGGNVWLDDPAQNISERGVDADFDGICDEPLEITGFGTDAYPLVYNTSCGTVTITSTPADAFVSVDGVNTARTAEGPFYIPAGAHTLSLHKEGYLPGEADVTVIAGGSVSVEIALTPITHPMTWTVSLIENDGNYTNVSAIPEIGAGDTIRIWGTEGHVYEGGFTIDKQDVRIMRWEGSPARPLITNTSGIAPAIIITADNATLQGLNISENTYAGDGAGVQARGTIGTHLQGFTITDCVFTGNEVSTAGHDDSGGAVFITWVDNSRVTDTVFENNIAGEHGGGMFGSHLSTPVLTDSVFTNNSASYRGGGVYFRESVAPALTRMTFENNTAGSYGAGVSFYHSDNAVLTGTTFGNNTAGEHGGGAYFEISHNAALTDTIFWNNTAVGNGGGAYFYDGSTNAVIKNCLFNNDRNLGAEASTAASLNENSPILQTNIVGGPYLGGNVWLNDPAQNISGWGVDADFDGICDEPLEITGFGTDAFPLVYGSTAEVTSTPKGAFVSVDGVKTTRTTDGSLYLMAGEHTITVSLDGYTSPAEQTVSVVASETASVSFALEPVPPPVPASHGSGGGCSDVSAGAARDLPAGGHASFGFQNSAITEIGVTAGEKIREILITVKKEALPPGVDAPVYAVYEYDEVTLYHTTDASIAGATLSFSVTKAWLEEQGFAPEGVLLYRCHDGGWHALPTRITGEDAGKYYFSAESPGLSLFAIGAVENDVPVVEATRTSEGEVTVSVIPVEAGATETQQSPVPYGLAVLATGMVYLLKKRQT